MDGKRNVYLIGTSSFLNDVSSEMIKPLLPLLIVSLGGGSVLVGLLNGLRNFISFSLRVIFGYLSDYSKKRKYWILSGYTIAAIFKFLLSFSNEPIEVVTFGASERLGKAIRTAPKDALISESMPKKKGTGYGIDLLMDRSGAIIGTLLVAFLVSKKLLQINQIILVASVISALAIIPAIFLEEPKLKKLKKKFFKSIKTLSKDVKKFLWVIVFFSIGNIGVLFTILRAKEILGSNVSTILLYTLFNLIYALLVIPFGRWGDKNRKASIILGLSLFAISSILFAIAKDIISLGIAFVIFGLAYAMSMGNIKAFIAEISKENERATALGTYQTVQGLISLPTALAAGALWTISPIIPFGYSAVAMAIAALLMIKLF